MKGSFLVRLFDGLWARYRSRVPYARVYEKLAPRFRNDHVAFRTIASQEPLTGIFSVSRLFEALGYSAARCYEFPDKHLSARHYRHPDPALPKVFISELKVWELSPSARRIIERSIKSHRAPFSNAFLAAPRLAEAARFFRELPWDLPRKKDVLELDRESQYAAWVLVNGYEVNHFTAAVSDIEKTVAALRRAGVPMKAEIEGARGSKLRQSSTEAAVVPVKVKDGSKTVVMDWPYAYFELAERRGGFEGFLGGQATNLFEMTARRGSKRF